MFKTLRGWVPEGTHPQVDSRWFGQWRAKWIVSVGD